MAIDCAVTTTDAIKVLSIADKAIDWETTDKAAYVEAYDHELLHLSGETPTWFYLRPFSRDEAMTLARRCQADFERTLEECFRMGVTRIDGLGKHIVRHEVVPGWFRKRLSDATVEKVPQEVRLEIGAVVWQWSTLPDGHRKN